MPQIMVNKSLIKKMFKSHFTKKMFIVFIRGLKHINLAGQILNSF